MKSVLFEEMGANRHLLKPYALDLEVYSIDEAFLSLPAVDYQEHGLSIVAMLNQSVGMPVCVGVAPTKTLSKLANHAAKKIPALNGVCVLDAAPKWNWLLQRLPVNEIWGVGRHLTQQLNAQGIHTALDLAQSDPKSIRSQYSVVLERTVRELNGVACADLEGVQASKNEIVCTRSFSYKITELNELQQAISQYAGRACEKLRAQNGLTDNFWVYLESFDKTVGYYCRHIIVELPRLTNDTRLIAKLAAGAVAEIYRPKLRYKKCGIGLLDIRSRQHEQSDFLNPEQSEKSQATMRLLDQINGRFGKQTVKLASTGLLPRWIMKREYLSPAYTTRWEDLPRVVC
ncbi:MAG: DUF4113 domain-containing protein [Gammaproteobacteria bacterium]|nr:DUF4113 domain-containing protein [Gammaproteobacteria bacterium]